MSQTASKEIQDRLEKILTRSTGLSYLECNLKELVSNVRYDYSDLDYATYHLNVVSDPELENIAGVNGYLALQFSGKNKIYHVFETVLDC